MSEQETNPYLDLFCEACVESMWELQDEGGRIRPHLTGGDIYMVAATYLDRLLLTFAVTCGFTSAYCDTWLQWKREESR